MAIASLIIGILGIILSFILGFPLSYLIGPFVGIAMGIVALILAAVAYKLKKSGVSKWALIISIAVTLICFFRIVSLVSCVGGIAGLLAGI